MGVADNSTVLVQVDFEVFGKVQGENIDRMRSTFGVENHFPLNWFVSVELNNYPDRIEAFEAFSHRKNYSFEFSFLNGDFDSSNLEPEY